MSLTTDMVKPQDLPRTLDERMQGVIVAFDVDGVLIQNVATEREYGVVNPNDVPIQRQIDLLKILSTYKNVRIVIWSGGGREYAQMWGNRLELDSYVWRYASKLQARELRSVCDHLIAIDDIQATAIGDINMIVREK